MNAERHRRYWHDGAALTLSDLVRETETKPSGRVQMISLADFRAAVGGLWDQYKHRILLIAETTIARTFDKGDVFIPLDAPDTDTWLLLLPKLDGDAALARTEAIAASIGDKLVGANFTLRDPPLPRAATLDLTGVITADGVVDAEALRAAVARARNAQATATTRTTRESATRQVKASARLRSAWSVDTELADAFFLRPAAATGEEIAIDTAAWPESVILRLCESAHHLLEDMQRQRLHAKLGLPMPYPLLYSPSGAKIRTLLAGMPQALRLLHLRIEITQVPPQVPAQQLAALRELLRPTVREIAFLVDAFAAPGEIYALDHIMIGADLSAARGFDESDLRAALGRMRAAARERRTYVLGLRSRAQFKIAFAAGIDEIGGQPVSPDLDHLPDRLQHIPYMVMAP